jgi:hypothetical protein
MIHKEFHSAIAIYGPKKIRFDRLPSGRITIRIGRQEITIPESDWIEIVTQVSLHDGEEFAKRIVGVLYRG